MQSNAAICNLFQKRKKSYIFSDDGSSWQFRTRQKFSCSGCGVVFSSSSSLANHRCSKVKQKLKPETFPYRKRIKKSTQEELVSASPEATSSIDIEFVPITEKSLEKVGVEEKTPLKVKEQKPEIKVKGKGKVIKSSDSSESEEEVIQPSKTPTKSPGNYQCSVCEKVFHSPGKLKQHSYSHTGERPFSCPYCQKAFSSRFKLGRHQLIHTGERQYRCHLCNRSFHRKDHLKNHIQIHDPNKQFKCQKPGCGKEYNSYMSYRKHCAAHAAEEGDLECKICFEMFDNKSDLIYHLKVHVGTRTVKSPSEKKFQCDQCERKFFTRKDVKRHLVVHTGKRDFVCSLCPQKFGRKDHLVRHIKKSHGVSDPSRMEPYDPLALPGPSSAPQALSPETTALSSTSASSGDQSFSSLLIAEPLPGPSKPYTPVSIAQPQETTYSSGSFQPEFRFFEEGIKEEPELTASMESIDAGGDDISKILGMYLPTGSINLPVPPLLEPGTSQLPSVSHEEVLSEGGFGPPMSIREEETEPPLPLLLPCAPIFEPEESGLSHQIISTSSASEEFQIPVESLLESSAISTQVEMGIQPSTHMLSRGFRSLLEEEIAPLQRRTIIVPSTASSTIVTSSSTYSSISTTPMCTSTTIVTTTTTTTATPTVVTTTSIVTTSESSLTLPGFDQAFP